MNNCLCFIDVLGGHRVKDSCCKYHDNVLYCNYCSEEVPNFSAPGFHSLNYDSLKFCHYCGGDRRKTRTFW